MRSIGIVIILAIASNCQVSPNWLQDIYVQAFDVTIINTDFIQSGTFTRSITYQTSMVTPYVILCSKCNYYSNSAISSCDK